jgi:ABC-type dipeptide/oligopeptide/nickel transport system permease component
MPPFLQFLIRRIFAMLISLVIITMVLYAGIMLTPPEARARIYLPPGKGGERATEAFINVIIKKYHLSDPYLVQYGYWMKSLVTGSWGYSPTMRGDVLTELLRRTPATLELSLYSLLLLIPLGLANGLMAGWRPNGWFDGFFRGAAFFGTSMPPFIFSMILISLFYINLGWLAPGRLDIKTELDMARTGFVEYTGALSFDSILNGRFDLLWVAFRHLVMPVVTLSIFHWATLGRVTRATIIGQRNKEYIIAARARGVSERTLLWKHALRAILAPSLTTIALSAASVVTSIFVVEIIFGLTGVSQVIVTAMSSTPDAPATLGFAVYSVLMVVGLMFILDMVQALLDPRVRDEVLKT